MKSRRVFLWGAAAFGVYLVVAAATLSLSGRHLLPLFEGVGPPPPYQWVNPPRAFAAGNTKPKPASADIALHDGKSVEAAAVTADGQLVVNFHAGGFAPHGTDTGVRATITPIDPATLGPVPPGLAADGNAYRVELSYQPSNIRITSLAAEGDIVLTAPTQGQVLLYSSDGSAWTKLATQPVGATSSVGSTFAHPGWYLVGASPTAVLPGANGKPLSTVLIAGLVAVLAILLASAPVAWRALRRRTGQRRTGPRRTRQRRPPWRRRAEPGPRPERPPARASRPGRRP